jgi:acyl carrier protein
MRVSTVEDRVLEISSEHFGVLKSQITRDTSLENDLGADSLDRVELQMKYEDDFDLSISDEDFDKIQTVGQCVQYIERRLQGLDE